jgi:hypothetical protein
MRIVQRINLGNRRQMGETDLNLGALPGGFGGLRAGRDLIAYPNLRGLPAKAADEDCCTAKVKRC